MNLYKYPYTSTVKLQFDTMDKTRQILVAVLMTSIMSCIFFSLFYFTATMEYVEVRNTRLLHRNTTCTVVNFTCKEQKCYSCKSDRDTNCTRYLCWGQYYSISYSIRNGTKVTSTIGSNKHDECKQQRKVRHLLIYRIFIF
jgi:hypothetical protein